MNNLAFERLKGRENFTEWKTGAKAFLTAKGSGIHITNPLSTSANATETANNQKALAELILLLEPSIYSYVEGINRLRLLGTPLSTILSQGSREKSGFAKTVDHFKFKWMCLIARICE